MKSGTGDDPFADPFEEADESSTEPESEPETEADSISDDETPDDAEADEAVDERDTSDGIKAVSETDDNVADRSDAETTSSTAADSTGRPDDTHIPWVLRRSSVKDDRPNITQFFLRDETDRGERGLRSDVEQILDKDVYTLDLREAAYLVAMEHPEEVAETLRDWGYDYLD